MSGYHISLPGLDQATRSLRVVNDQLMALGTHGDEKTGSSIESLALDSDELASRKVSDTLSDLLERSHYRWAEMQESMELVAELLIDTRTTYEIQEEQNAAEFTWNPSGQDGQP